MSELEALWQRAVMHLHGFTDGKPYWARGETGGALLVENQHRLVKPLRQILDLHKPLAVEAAQQRWGFGFLSREVCEHCTDQFAFTYWPCDSALIVLSVLGSLGEQET
jgi:hypothetical protein